ncbi:hypothetical protein C7M84_005652 [Penaeus vannamei]|uniref:Uncharacterized protein n=1 Tax=Penaeus vannamei TaxID=6689 RepID=A0A3R7N2W4_PENVA|nr:hypothetical protein C7M84_005652 [Penaeus vannamei]
MLLRLQNLELIQHWVAYKKLATAYYNSPTPPSLHPPHPPLLITSSSHPLLSSFPLSPAPPSPSLPAPHYSSSPPLPFSPPPFSSLPCPSAFLFPFPTLLSLLPPVSLRPPSPLSPSPPPPHLTASPFSPSPHSLPATHASPPFSPLPRFPPLTPSHLRPPPSLPSLPPPLRRGCDRIVLRSFAVWVASPSRPFLFTRGRPRSVVSRPPAHSHVVHAKDPLGARLLCIGASLPLSLFQPFSFLSFLPFLFLSSYPPPLFSPPSPAPRLLLSLSFSSPSLPPPLLSPSPSLLSSPLPSSPPTPSLLPPPFLPLPPPLSPSLSRSPSPPIPLFFPPPPPPHSLARAPQTRLRGHRSRRADKIATLRRCHDSRPPRRRSSENPRPIPRSFSSTKRVHSGGLGWLSEPTSGSSQVRIFPVGRSRRTTFPFLFRKVLPGRPRCHTGKSLSLIPQTAAREEDEALRVPDESQALCPRQQEAQKALVGDLPPQLA